MFVSICEMPFRTVFTRLNIFRNVALYSVILVYVNLFIYHSCLSKSIYSFFCIFTYMYLFIILVQVNSLYTGEILCVYMYGVGYRRK
jgi:hypothetical protein